MSRRVKYKYFVNGVETDRESIDWNQTSTVTFKDDTVNVQQLDKLKEAFKKFQSEPILFREPLTKSNLGMSAISNKDFNDLYSPLVAVPKSTCSKGILCRCDGSCKEEWKTLKTNFPNSIFQKAEHPLKKEGVKHNDNKLPMDKMITIQFPKALNAICKATLFGHNKYFESDKDFLNFKKVKGGSQTYADALQRHNFNKGEIAEDSKLPHIFHKAWNALAELELWIEENKYE